LSPICARSDRQRSLLRLAGTSHAAGHGAIPAQPLESQAFAAMMALRWRLIDHPHVRQASSATWGRLGVSMIEHDERYAVTLTHERLAEMQARMAELG